MFIGTHFMKKARPIAPANIAGTAMNDEADNRAIPDSP